MPYVKVIQSLPISARNMRARGIYIKLFNVFQNSFSAAFVNISWPVWVTYILREPVRTLATRKTNATMSSMCLCGSLGPKAPLSLLGLFSY